MYWSTVCVSVEQINIGMIILCKRTLRGLEFLKTKSTSLSFENVIRTSGLYMSEIFWTITATQ